MNQSRVEDFITRSSRKETLEELYKHSSDPKFVEQVQNIRGTLVEQVLEALESSQHTVVISGSANRNHGLGSGILLALYMALEDRPMKVLLAVNSWAQTQSVCRSIEWLNLKVQVSPFRSTLASAKERNFDEQFDLIIVAESQHFRNPESLIEHTKKLVLCQTHPYTLRRLRKATPQLQ